MVLGSFVSGVSQAQQLADAASPPTIEHDEFAYDGSVAVQVFTATVQGGASLVGVGLYHRFPGESTYRRTEMTPIAGTAIYSASVSTPLGKDRPRAIEYYIRAEDATGNLALKGFTFNPLERELSAAIAAEPASGTADGAQSTGRSRVLYYVLGALAIGAIAGLAGGGSGGGSDNGGGTEECADVGCLVTLTVGAP